MRRRVPGIVHRKTRRACGLDWRDFEELSDTELSHRLQCGLRSSNLGRWDTRQAPEAFALLEHTETSEQSSSLLERQDLTLEARAARAH